MQFRVCVYVPRAKEQSIQLITGLDIGELGSCIIEIPTEQYRNDPETSMRQITKIATDYMSKIVGIEIAEVM